MMRLLALIAAFSLLAVTGAAAQSCGAISSCPAASLPLTGLESVVGVQNAKTVQMQIQSIANLARANPLGSRALIPVTTIGTTAVQVGGYSQPGDLGAGAIYTSVGCTAGGTQAIADATGVYYCLVINGPVNAGWFGVYCDYNTGTLTGHDDTAALLAAVATGVDVYLGNPPSAGAGFIACGVSAPIVMTARGQGWTQSRTTLAAMPGFVGSYVFETGLGAGNETITNANCDGGQQLGLTISCFKNQGGANLWNFPIAHHYAVYGMDWESPGKINQYNFNEWLSTDAQFSNSANFTAYGLFDNAADSQIIGGSASWNLIQNYFSCGAQSTQIVANHSFAGRPVAQANPFPNAINFYISGCAGSDITIDNNYDDNGSIEIYATGVQITGNWPLSSNSSTQYINNCLINVYPNGNEAHPTKLKLGLTTIGPGGITSGLNYVCIQDSNKSVVVAGSSGTGATATLTIAGWTNDTPQPTTAGYINVTGNGAYNCTHCKVTAVGPTTVSYASTATGTVTGGAIAEAWNDDWTGLPSTQPNGSSYQMATGAVKVIQGDPNQPAWWTYEGSAGTNGCIDTLWEIGAQASVPHVCFGGSTNGFLVGMGVGNKTQITLGDETSPGPSYLYDDGAGNLTVGGRTNDRWQWASGVYRPIGNAQQMLGGLSNYILEAYTEILTVRPRTLVQIDADDMTPNDGDQAYFTDATACTFNALIVNGGAVRCTAHFDTGTGGASFTATIAATTMTVSAISAGSIVPGTIISGSGVTGGTTITALASGTGQTGTYTISPTQTVAAPTTITTNGAWRGG